MSTLAICIQHSTGNLAKTIRQEKEIKDTQIGKEDVKLFLFADGMILYVENRKGSKNKLEVINEISILAWGKMNVQKSAAFLYVNITKSFKMVILYGENICFSEKLV